ncbi:MAG: hypothetical protein JXA77_04025 [Bacteroidales bacterium]|nr:hypothetical protein [Bacteroidales bacterium]
MTIQQINERRKVGDLQRVKEMSGIHRRTVDDVIYGKTKPTSKKAKEVIKWFEKYYAAIDSINNK